MRALNVLENHSFLTAAPQIESGAEAPRRWYLVEYPEGDKIKLFAFSSDDIGVRPSAWCAHDGSLVVLVDTKVLVVNPETGITKQIHDLSFPVFDLWNNGKIVIVIHECGLVRLTDDLMHIMWSRSDDITTAVEIDSSRAVASITEEGKHDPVLVDIETGNVLSQ